MQLFVTNESKTDIFKEQKLGQCHKTNLGAQKENQSMTSQLIIIKSPVKQKKVQPSIMRNFTTSDSSNFHVMVRQQKKNDFFSVAFPCTCMSI